MPTLPVSSSICAFSRRSATIDRIDSTKGAMNSRKAQGSASSQSIMHLASRRQRAAACAGFGAII
jgi:hypothetical protein